MITFKQFVTEEVNHVSEMHELIKRDCKPWLEATAGLNAYRGMKFDSANMDVILDKSQKFICATVRKDRKPADSPQWLHDAMNAHFVEKIGIPLRTQSVFAGTIDTAFTYSQNSTGNVYAIYPIGKFEYAWSDIIYDPTMIFYSNSSTHLFGNRNTLSKIFKKYWDNNAEQHGLPDYDTVISSNLSRKDPKVISMIINFIKFNNFWKYNTGLQEILGQNKTSTASELMIVCDKYYAVEYRYCL